MTIKAGRGGRRDKDKKPDLGAKLNALPNTFKFAAESLKIMSERGGSAGSIVVNKYKSYNYKLIYALVMNTAKNIKMIKKIIHEMKLMKKVTENNPFLLEVLVGDLLFGKGLKSVEQNTTAASILSLKDSIVKQQEKLKKDYSADEETAGPKYLRINHLRSNIEHVLSQLKSVGLKQVEYSKDKIKFKKFINKFKSLEDDEFMLDFHFPDDLIIMNKTAATRLRKIDLVRKGKAMLQDKASFMAIEAMGVKSGDRVVDACCAPGCKTTLIGCKMRNKGKIFAYDVDKKRMKDADHLLKLHGITCVKTEVCDFSKVKLTRLLKVNTIDKLDCILIDPSCSGSGISNRIDYKTSSVEAGRLKKLQAFQVALLKHALKSDTSKSIVYCTCSTSVEENEQAIEMALNECGKKGDWDVAEVLPYWQTRGDENYEFGGKCIRSDSNNLTNGFFIAKLVRKECSESPVCVKKLEVKHEADEDVKIKSEDHNEVESDEDDEVESEDVDDEDDDDDDDDVESEEDVEFESEED